MSMMNVEPIAGIAQLDHTAFDPHFRITEATKLKLDDLFQAMDVMATISSVPESQRAIEFGADHLAPVFRSLATLGHALMAEAAIEIPQLPVKVAA